MPYLFRGIPVEQCSGACKQQLQVVIQLGHRADCGAAGTHRVGLVNGDRRGDSFDLVNGRFVHAVQKLARISRERLNIAALPFGIQRVKHQAGLARATGAGNNSQFASANVEVEVLEVVLASAANADDSLGHGLMSFL